MFRFDVKQNKTSIRKNKHLPTQLRTCVDGKQQNAICLLTCGDHITLFTLTCRVVAHASHMYTLYATRVSVEGSVSRLQALVRQRADAARSVKIPPRRHRYHRYCFFLLRRIARKSLLFTFHPDMCRRIIVRSDAIIVNSDLCCLSPFCRMCFCLLSVVCRPTCAVCRRRSSTRFLLAVADCLQSLWPNDSLFECVQSINHSS